MTFTAQRDPERDALIAHLRHVGKWPIEKIARHYAISPDMVSGALRRAARMTADQRRAALWDQRELPV